MTLVWGKAVFWQAEQYPVWNYTETHKQWTEPGPKPPHNHPNRAASGKKCKMSKTKNTHIHLETLFESDKTNKSELAVNMLLTVTAFSRLRSFPRGFKDDRTAQNLVSIKVVLFSERQAKRMLSVAKIQRCHNQRAPLVLLLWCHTGSGDVLKIPVQYFHSFIQSFRFDDGKLVLTGSDSFTQPFIVHRRWMGNIKKDYKVSCWKQNSHNSCMALKCTTVKAGYLAKCADYYQGSLSVLVSGERDSSSQVVHALFLSGKA